MRKYNKHLWRVLLIIFCGTTICSCKKYLDQEPKDQFSSSTFYNNESNVFMALTGLYLTPGTATAQKPDWWFWSGFLDLDESTDNAYDRRGENVSNNKLTNGTMTPSLDILLELWDKAYLRIAKCNNFLQHVEESPINENVKKRYKGEARFIRACMYFYLSQYFGDVPLVLEVLSPEEANNVKKSKKSEINSFLEKEFTESSEDMPRYKDMPKSEFGRANKQAALAFLGRVYMAQKKWTDAVRVYQEIIDFGDNAIDPNYSSLFDGTNELSSELIFSIRYTQDLSPTTMLKTATPAILSGFVRFCPLGSLVESYEFDDGSPFSYGDPRFNYSKINQNRDPRLKYTIACNEDTVGGKVYISDPNISSSPDQLGAGKQATQTGYALKKYLPGNASSIPNLANTGIDLPIIRYAEILLSYIESKIEAGEQVSQDILDITVNKIRGRASVNMPPIAVTAPSGLLTKVRQERRIELAFEGMRYWDLLRWQIADSVLSGYFYGAPFPNANKLAKAPNGQVDPYYRWYVTQKHFRMEDYQWPIPQSEVDKNPNLK